MNKKNCPNCFSYLRNGKCSICGYVDSNIEDKTLKKKRNLQTFGIALGLSLIICYVFLFIGKIIESNFLISFYLHPLRVMVPTFYLTYRIRNTKFKLYDVFIALFLMLLTDFLMIVCRVL